MVSKGLVVPVLLAALLVPAMTAQPSGELNQEILATEGSEITFYGHTLGNSLGNGANTPMPMNTQFPDGADDYSLGTRYVEGCNFPADVNPDDGGDCFQDWFWYTTAGFVQVKSPDAWQGYHQFHNERGQTKDIYFDTDKPPVSTLYMSADAHGWLVALCDASVPCWNWDPGYFPEWVVETFVWHANLGDWASDPDAKPDLNPVRNRDENSVLIAHGKTTPFDMYSFDPNIPVVGGQTVWPFTAELEWDVDFVADGGVVPFNNDLIVEFRWFEEAPNGEKYFVPGMTWNLNGGEDYPNNVVFPVRNPLDVELVFPRFVHEKLVVLSVLNTPWGSYDVDMDTINIEFRNAAGNTVVPDADKFQEFIDVSVAHSGHYDPINVTWIWDIVEQDLPAGDYDIVVSAENFQGSYYTETLASFTINKDGSGGDATAGQSGLLSFTNEQFDAYKEGAGVNDDPAEEGESTPDSGSESKDSPGLGAFGGLAALGALAFLRRRA